ncbi:MAG TPA: HD domain-containing phosphohydrolase [Syntrophorhabdaceae bacterium]|nr:HD domain-containing phosphohydrolase [Syntrophorhabdaceae bacterium]
MNRGHSAQRAERVKSILLVEDSRLQATSLAEILINAGYDVRVGYDGAKGLAMLGESAYDLVISDVWMPRVNGYEFCRRLKSDKAFKDIPVILLTSMSDFGNVVEGLNSGADFYLTKPYSETLLLSMVGHIFSGGDHYEETGSKIFLDVSPSNGSASSPQTFNFLFSTYKNLLYQNESLAQTKQELRKLNDQLEHRVQEKTDSLRKALNGVVMALSKIVEIRDPYTAGHQSRVAELARAIGKEIGFSEDRCDGIRTMGLLHDIGKIIVPSEILCKPSRLTEYEFDFIKEHSRAGYEILEGIEFPWPLATAIIQHHERLNGSGYPSGLLGEDILEEAKILAVADVIESMASHRPYRPALGIDLALQEISVRRGTLYDPGIVGATLKLFKQKAFSFG